MGKPKGGAMVSFMTRMDADRGLHSGEPNNLRLFSLMFAYVRLMGKKSWRALRAATMRNGECREAEEEGGHRPRTCLAPVLKIARSGDRAYRASGFSPFPAGRVPSRGVR